VRFYLVRCVKCEMDVPFRSAQDRQDWMSAHSEVFGCRGEVAWAGTKECEWCNLAALETGGVVGACLEHQRVAGSPCRIVGPYLPAGDVDWMCRTHDVPAILLDASRYGHDGLRREDFRCPIGAPR
jgi:hypothetical protein